MNDRPELAPLEATARAVASEWGLRLEQPFGLSRYSYVAPVGGGGVLKITSPRDRESTHEADALELWGEKGR